jgi:hypothetical protein
LLRNRNPELHRDGFQLIAALTRIREDLGPQIVSCGLFSLLTLASARENFQLLLLNARCCLHLLPVAPEAEVTALFATLLTQGVKRGRVLPFFLDAISRPAISPTVLRAFLEVDLVGVVLDSFASDHHSFQLTSALKLLSLLLVDFPLIFPIDFKVLHSLKALLPPNGSSARLEARILDSLSPILIASDHVLLKESGLVPLLLPQLGDPLTAQQRDPELMGYLALHGFLLPSSSDS